MTSANQMEDIPLEDAGLMLSYVRGVEDRATWVKMAFIMHEEYGDAAFGAWDQWSQGSQTYKERDARTVWKSCGKGGGSTKATIGTLVALAKEGGWRPTNTDRKPVDPAELEQRRADREKRLNAQRQQAELDRLEAARRANDLLASAKVANGHAYLERKGIAGTSSAKSAMEFDGELLIPMYSGPKQIVGLQRIAADGSKKFIYGQEKKGCYHTISKPNGAPIVIVEGYATGVSVSEATGYCVVVAFDAGNLEPVARKIRGKLPDAQIIIGGDDDAFGEKNIGATAAIEAARAIGAFVAKPIWIGDRGDGTDFNDLQTSEGLDAVRMCFEDPQAPEQPTDATQPQASTRRPKPERGASNPGSVDPDPSFQSGGRAVSEPGPDLPPSQDEPAQRSDVIPVAMSELAKPLTDYAPEYSETDMSARHVDRMGGNALWCEMWGRWLVWSGTRWIRDETLQVREAITQTCKAAAIEVMSRGDLTENKRATKAERLTSARGIASVETIAKSDRRAASHPNDWDADNWLLNTPAGVIDLTTGNIRPHKHSDRMLKAVSVAPAPGCPTWLSFLDTATGGDKDLQAFLKRMCGYSLTGEIREHALFFVYGTGGNGKGTFLNTITAIMGDYQTVAGAEVFTEQIGERHTTELASLYGARLVTAQETEEGKRWAESRIKALTGGDPITARYMRQDNFTFMPKFKLVIVGNHKPSFRSVDDAIRRRLHLVPFTAVIPAEKRDPGLPAKLHQELPGILQWMIDGCLEWQRVGLAPPEIVKSSTESYLTAEDSLQQWLDECCTLDTVSFSSSSALFASWSKWCEDAGEYAGSNKRLMARLETRGVRVGQKFRGMRGCIGIKMNDTRENRYENERDAY